jgi:anti-sigma-K factor RskA
MSQAMDCATADELGAAAALGALEVDERQALADHLATCPEPHAELRAMLGADAVLAAGLEPVTPSTGLRDRLMATVERTPQEHRPMVSPPERATAPRRGWLDWLSPRVARPLALVAVVSVVVVGAWDLNLQGQLTARDRALQAVASAIAGGEVAYRLDGDAGRGYVVDTPGPGAALVVADLEPVPSGSLYELWLLDSQGTPVAAGSFTPPTSEEVAVVQVEKDLAGYATFAVTVERQRVSAPTTTPVMVAPLSPAS